MDKSIRRIPVLALLLITMFLVGCSGLSDPATPYPSEVDWETAIEILNSGEVEMVVQLHSLEVTLTLKDGSEVRTIEPSIDLIFQEVDKCGRVCRGIILATE